MKLKTKLLFLLSLFLLSRIPFINHQLLFMDSQEYLSRLSNPDLLQGLIQGHLPLHPGFILLLWPVVQISNLLDLNPILAIKISNCFFALVSLIIFYCLARTFFTKKSVDFATTCIALTPMFWISNLAILTESAYILFFLIALYAAQKYLISSKMRWLIAVMLSLGLAYSIHQIIVIFLPAFSLLLLNKKSLLTGKKLLSLALTIFLGLLVSNSFLACLYVLRGYPLNQAFVLTITGKAADRAQLSFSLLGLARISRNWLILLLRSFSNLFVISAILGWFYLHKRKGKVALVLALWFLPSFIAAQWWDGLLMGRYLLISVFPMALSAAIFFEKSQILRSLLFLTLIITSIGAVWLLNQPLPARLVQASINKLPQNGLLIESHFFRPWLNYAGKLMLVNEPNTPQNFQEEVEHHLGNNQPVFITSQALADPYGVYTGPFIHPLSLSYFQSPKLNSFKKNYHLSAVATPSAQDHLAIYQIMNQPPHSEIQIQTVSLWHRRRLDFFDPLSQLWFLITKTFKIDKIPV